MFPVRESKLLSTSHADIGVRPLGRRRGVEHTARNVLLGREVEALVLEGTICLGDVCQAVSPLRRRCPGLDQFQNLALDLCIHWLRRGTRIAARLHQTAQVIHELSARNLEHEVAASILDAGIRQVERGDLDVGILVAYTSFQASHRLFGRDRLGADDVADLEVERDVFERGGGGALDLRIELRGASAAEP